MNGKLTTLRQIERRLREVLNVCEVKYASDYTDFALTCFADSVRKAIGVHIGVHIDVQVIGPWFAPTNTSHTHADAIVYRIWPVGA